MKSAYRVIAALQVLFVCILIAVTVLIFFPLQKNLSAQVLLLRNEIVEVLEKSLGNNISFSSIHPSIFSYIEIRNLRVYDDLDNTMLSLDRVIFRYDIRKLFAGNPLSAPTMAEIRGGSMYLDTFLTGNASRQEQSSGESIDEIIASLSTDLRILVRNLRIDYADSHDRFQVDTLLTRGEIQLSGRTANFSVDTIVEVTPSDKSDAGNMGVIAGAGRIQGQLIPGKASGLTDFFDTSIFQIYLSTGVIESQLFDLQPLELYVSLDADKITLRSLEGKQPFAMEVGYNLNSNGGYIDFNSVDWSPSSIIRLKSSFEQYNRLLDSVISMELRAGTDENFRVTSADARLDAELWLPVVETVVNIDGQASLNELLLEIPSIEISSREGDRLSISGQADFASQSITANARFNQSHLLELPSMSGGLSLDYSDGSLAVDVIDAHIQGLALADSHLQGRISPTLSRFDLTTGPKYSDGRIHLHAQLSQTERASDDILSVELAFEALTFRDVVASLSQYNGQELSSSLIPAEFSDANITGTVQMMVDSPFETPSISLQTQNIRLIHPTYGESAALVATYKNNMLEIPVFRVNLGNDRASFQLNGNFSNPERYELLMHSEFNSFLYDSEIIAFPNRKSINLKGDFGSYANIRMGARNSALSFGVDNMPLPGLGELSSMTIRGQANINSDSPNLSLIELQDFSIENARLFPLNGNRLGRIQGQLKGSIENGIEISNVSYRDFLSTISGSGSVYATEDGIASTIQIGNEMESIDLLAGYANGQLDAQLAIQNMPMRRFGLEDIIGVASGSIQVQGEIVNPNINFDIATTNSKFSNDNLNARLQGSYQNQILRLSDSSFELSSLAIESIDGEYAVTQQQLVADAEVFLINARGERSRGNLIEAEISLPAIDEILNQQSISTLSLADYWQGANGAIRMSLMEPQTIATTNTDEDQQWQLLLHEQDGSLRFNGGPEDFSNAMSGYIDRNGNFFAISDPQLPVSFQVDGFFEGSTIDANFRDLRVNLDEMLRAQQSNDSDFQFLGGVAEGAFRISGSVVDPEFYGTLNVDHLRAKLEMIPEQLVAPKGYVIFEGKDVFIPKLSVAVGQSTKSTLSGSMSLNRWSPENLILNIDTEDQSVPVSSDFDSVVVDGYARGQVEIGMNFPSSALYVRGDITAEATGITLSQQEDVPNSETNQNPLDIDLSITTGRGVEFYWPTQRFPILRGTALSGDNIALTYSYPANTFSLRGDVALRGGEIFYFEQDFYIRDGEIAFDESLENFDPVLSLNAEGRGADSSGSIRIYLEIDHDRLSQLQPRFSSDPIHTEAEIIALLGGQIIGAEDGEEIQLSDALISSSELLGQIGIFRTIEDEIRDSLSLDLFSLKTGLFQNILQDVIVTPDTEFSLNSNRPITLGRYLQNTTLLMGKYIGNEVFMELMVQLQEQNPAEQAINDFIGLEVDAELSLDWQTPFFDLTWTFSPENPENLFVTDHVLTFTRDFSPGRKQ